MKIIKIIIAIFVVAIVSMLFVSNVNAGINEDIRIYAQEQWPNDYKMQVHVINQNVEACQELNVLIDTYRSNDDFVKILNSAYENWYPQFNMVLHVVKGQVKAYNQLGNTFTQTTTSTQTTDQIRSGRDENGYRTFTNR